MDSIIPESSTRSCFQGTTFLRKPDSGVLIWKIVARTWFPLPRNASGAMPNLPRQKGADAVPGPRCEDGPGARRSSKLGAKMESACFAGDSSTRCANLSALCSKEGYKTVVYPFKPHSTTCMRKCANPLWCSVEELQRLAKFLDVDVRGCLEKAPRPPALRSRCPAPPLSPELPSPPLCRLPPLPALLFMLSKH